MFGAKAYTNVIIRCLAKYRGETMRETVVITKALADENRLRIIMMVQDKEACVCQIVEVLGNASSTVSKHLSILKGAGLIESYKQGRWIYYHLPKEPSKVARKALEWVRESLEDSEAIRSDRLKGTVVCEQEPEAVAKSQRER